MSRVRYSSILTGLLLFAATSAFPATDGNLQAAVERVVKDVKPTLVRIHVVSTSYREGREMKFQSSGSGAIITPEGHVITNHHVAGHATRLVCTLSNREEIDAELVGTDPLSDIAVIKLLGADGQTFPVARFGDSDKASVGDPVLAMGSPRALSQSVTLGIISNSAMVLPRRMGMSGSLRLDGEDVGSMVRWIAHDAEIHPGNSGGPLFNIDGEIIGINEISIGLAGAIPGNLAMSVAHEIMEKGAVERAWLGVGLQPLLKHGKQKDGVLITGTFEGSPAEEAGIESGDILIAVNGKAVRVRFDEDLPGLNLMIAELPLEDKATFTILRGREKINVTAVPRLREPVLAKQREFKQWGITGRNISFVSARQMKRDSQDGVVITSIRPGGPAGDAKPSVSRGDIILRVGDTDIRNTDDLIAVTKTLTAGAEEPVPVLTTYERKSERFVSVIKVGIRELNDPGLEVKKAWLPVETQVITRDISELIGKEKLTGFRVTKVYADSTASEAGLEVGDLITHVDGERLTASEPEHYEELPTLIRNYRIGTEAELSVVRDGDPQTVSVELMRSPKPNREMRKFRDDNFEFTARDITFFDKADERWEQDQEGVIIDEVKSGGWASLGMLRVGDLLLAVNATSIGNVDELREAMGTVEAAKPSAVVLKVRRGILTMFVELEPKWD